MSLPLSARSLADTEYFKQLYRLSDEIIQLLLRDFGLKTLNSDLNAFTYRAKMTEEDRQVFTDLSNKYHVNVESSYPYWLIDYYRHCILHILEQLISNITVANTIYANSETCKQGQHYTRTRYKLL